MIKKNKGNGRKFAGNPSAAPKPAAERRSQQEPARDGSTLQDQLAQDDTMGTGENRTVSEQLVSNSNRRQMQMEQIEVSDPADLSLTQAIKNKRNGKRSSKK